MIERDRSDISQTLYYQFFGICMCTHFKRVIKLFECYFFVWIVAGEREFDEIVCKVGVFGQKCAMHITPKDIFIDASLDSIGDIITVSFEYVAQRRKSLTKLCLSSMVFKSHKRLGLYREPGLNHDIAYAAMFDMRTGRNSDDIEYPQARYEMSTRIKK